MRVMLPLVAGLALAGCVPSDTTNAVSVDEDGDGDGVLTADDCDDQDPALGAVDEDDDCDGVVTADDCDDQDAAMGAVDEDSDCDGVLTEDDCDDQDAALGAVDKDGDCDGALTEDDCDDSDARSTVVDEDADCDGFVTEEDCDDSDPLVYPGAPEVGLGLLEDLACDGGGGSLALADFAFVGENDEDAAGCSVRAAGDVDGDGLDDLLVGAYGNDDGGRDAGKAYLVLGSTLAASPAPAPTLDLGTADFAFVGENGEDFAGRSVSAAGDVDGDGLGDLLVGAYGNDDRGSNAGKAYLVLGSTLAASPSTTLGLSTADLVFVGESPSDSAGRSVSAAGDVDGDGLDDVLVGAPVNGDGGGAAGKAYLVLGSTLTASPSTTFDLGSADFAFVGENAEDFAGRSLSAAGDVDGDGLDDLLLGASGNDDGGDRAGKAYLVFGSTLAASPSTTLDLSDADFAFVGETASDAAGGSLSAAGDVDGDGLGDLFFGAPLNADGGSAAGKAYLVLGSTLAASPSTTLGLGTADFAFVGENPHDYAGRRVGAAGDVDGDGLDDLLLGADGNDDGASGGGKVYLVLGSTLAASPSSTVQLGTADFAFVGENPSDSSGISVSTAGDVDGDGRNDLLVGADRNDDGGSSAGKAYLILSNL